MVALTGAITGLAASLSMASSAYMQAQYEREKSAKKAALYTGGTYVAVVVLLLLPFLILTQPVTALVMLVSIVVVIIAAISYYTSVLFEKSFWNQFAKRCIFSLGVALVTFIIGYLLRLFFAIEI